MEGIVAEKRFVDSAWCRQEGMMLRVAQRVMIAVVIFGTMAISGRAQMMPNPYGANVTLETAKKLAAPAIAEAEKNHWNVAVAIVDTSGNLVYYEKMDNTQLGSATIAVDKARTAALFKRPTKAFEDAAATPGGARVVGMHNVIAVEGGLPLVLDGKIVGAIGVSGATSAQDAQCANAGTDLLEK
jgi:glc operon protein GlcG